MPAAAPKTRRSSSSKPLPRWAWIAGGTLLAVAAYLIYRRRTSSSSILNTSGTPGPDLTGSAAQQPSGGAGTIPGNLPSGTITEPAQVVQQVQQTEGSSTQAPASISPPVVWNPPAPAPITPPVVWQPPTPAPITAPPGGWGFSGSGGSSDSGNVTGHGFV